MKKVKYEARLNRDIKRTTAYGIKRTYKKGTVMWSCSEKIFKKLTHENIEEYVNICICEGHGVYEYFDLQKDIEFFKVETVIKKTEYKVKLKNK